jgi:hypothetical protein
MLETVSSDVNPDVGTPFPAHIVSRHILYPVQLVASKAFLHALPKFSQAANVEPGACRSCLIANARMNWVRYRSHATYSRQPRQVRKEATVTGSCVCSESPVPDLIFSTAQTSLVRQLSDYVFLHSFTTLFAGSGVPGHL